MEKTSIRWISRVLDHHRDKISKYFHLIRQHAEILYNHYIRDISASDCEFDEIWSFIQKILLPDDSYEFGDCWTYTGFQRELGLMISFNAGKRVEETC